MFKQTILSIFLLMFSIQSSAENPQVVFETNKGNFVVELYPEKAPITVKNFLNYMEAGFYDQTIFHRVIKQFMIQGGGFTENMVKKETNAAIKNEANNGLRNEVGTIAMARTGDPNSATAQFFINVNHNNFLDYRSPDPANIGYCVFGHVIQGMDTVFNISDVSTHQINGRADIPIESVIIHKVKLN